MKALMPQFLINFFTISAASHHSLLVSWSLFPALTDDEYIF